MTTTPADDAASILGPITPIHCPLTGCHWSCHGVPDKYADSRARIVREHLAAEHAPEDAEHALATARRVVGEATTDTGVGADGLRDRIATALADADGWVWAAGFDKTQSPSYQGYLRQADAVMAVLPTGADQPADRRARYRAAIRENDGWVLDDGQHMLDAVMAVADAEQQELRAQAAVLSAELTRRAPLLGEYAAQMANLRTMYDVADGRANDLIEERDALRAEVERLRADRATVRTAIRRLVAHAVGFQDVLDEGDQGAWGKTIGADIAELRRLADEAQQPTGGEVYPARHEWRLETHDPLADKWNQGSPYRDRAEAVARHQLREERFPTWKDGTRVERRLVRATTTYTVEQPAPAVTEEPTR